MIKPDHSCDVILYYKDGSSESAGYLKGEDYFYPEEGKYVGSCYEIVEKDIVRWEYVSSRQNILTSNT